VESRYYGNPTNSLPQDYAPTDSQPAMLSAGLDPTNPLSTFRAAVNFQARQATRNSPGLQSRKNYAVEFANGLAGSGITFTQALTMTETNVPAGVASTETFVTTTQTGGPARHREPVLPGQAGEPMT